MDSVRISVPLRASNSAGKKMRKRRELDALVASNGLNRYSGYISGGPVYVKPWTNYHDQLLSESADETEDYWKARSKANKKNRLGMHKTRFPIVFTLIIAFLTISCFIVTSTTLWLFLDLKHQTNFLHSEVNRVSAGNQGIPESFHKYNLQTKELQKNQSDLYSHVITLDKKIINLTSEMISLYSELEKVQIQLKISYDSSGATMSLGKLSNNAKILLRGIAEINGTVAQLRTTENHLQEVIQMLQSNLTNIKAKLDGVSNESNNLSLVVNPATTAGVSDLSESISALSENVTYLNDSLSSKFNALKKECSRDAAVLESVKQLFNQNISTRLNKVENEFSILDFHQFNNTVNVKLKSKPLVQDSRVLAEKQRS